MIHLYPAGALDAYMKAQHEELIRKAELYRLAEEAKRAQKRNRPSLRARLLVAMNGRRQPVVEPAPC